MELVINFSGGKDSCVLLAYLTEKYPHIKKHVVFADTGWEHEGTEDWCRSMVDRFGLELNVVRNPNKTFLSMVEARRKFPGMQTRQCTSDLKRSPIQTWIRQNVKDSLIINCLGIRSEESSGRAKQRKLSRNKLMTNSRRTVWDWNPIKDMKEKEVFQFLEQRNIPLHPVYKYLRRFSCRICIYMTEHDIEKVRQNDPQAVQIIKELERKINFSIMPSGFLK